MHSKERDGKKPQKEKMHLMGELMGSADQINLDGISEPQKFVNLNDEDENEDDEDEVTMKKNCDHD